MTHEKATDFFSILFGGEHHITGKIKPCGYGWELNDRWKNYASFDSYLLTKLTLMAHKYAVRVEICPSGPGMLKICIWQRSREGRLSERHPTIEEAINNIKLPDKL